MARLMFHWIKLSSFQNYGPHRLSSLAPPAYHVTKIPVELPSSSESCFSGKDLPCFCDSVIFRHLFSWYDRCIFKIRYHFLFSKKSSFYSFLKTFFFCCGGRWYVDSNEEIKSPRAGTWALMTNPKAKSILSWLGKEENLSWDRSLLCPLRTMKQKVSWYHTW